ncbi:MAG: Rossmann-like domain-containing protein [Thermoleophilia bacterium]
MSASWYIYDRLIDGIASDAVADACLVGSTWTLVQAEGIGMAMTYPKVDHDGGLEYPVSGGSLRELATHIKSWDLKKASMGMAAVNAFYNVPDKVEAWVGRPLHELRTRGAFTDMVDDMVGKKVAVIGHFPGLEAMAARCEFTILERNPLDGDLPDFAAEYVLPEQDHVFITGTALTNKTMPRLLELSAQATVALVGPTVPLVPWLFDHGVDILAGTVVMDPSQVWKYCEEGGHKGVFDHGAWMVDIRKSRI